MKRWVYVPLRSLAHAWLRSWNRMRVVGTDAVPTQGGLLLVANHASYLDPPAVGCGLGRAVHFLARSTLGSFGPARWVLSALGVVFVDRDGSARRGLAGAIEALQEGRVVCVFPEGTRSRTGRVGDFKRGAMLLLKRAAVPVVPVGIEGSFAALRHGAWFPRPARITVRYGQPMTAAEVMAPGGIDELRRRVCALAGEHQESARSSPSESSSEAPSEFASSGVEALPDAPSSSLLSARSGSLARVHSNPTRLSFLS